MFVIEPSHNAERGLSLVELLVGLTVGLLVIFAALSMFAVAAMGARNTLGTARLNAEVRAAMDVIVEDVRRAGFGGDAFTQAGTTDLAVYENGSCLVYSYDEDLNGVVNSASPYEYFGFRVDDDELKVRYGSGDLSACGGENRLWEALTDNSILEIEALSQGEAYFSIDYQCLRSRPASTSSEIGSGQRCASGSAVYDAAAVDATASGSSVVLVETRKVTVTLPVRLTTESAMRIRLSQEVMVRNHRIVEVPAS
jgi:type IV pilus assembly protein PilW